jgi:hypothetical protein
VREAGEDLLVALWVELDTVERSLTRLLLDDVPGKVVGGNDLSRAEDPDPERKGSTAVLRLALMAIQIRHPLPSMDA